ncbi:Protein of unknown function DUF4244 [Acidimicrobiia bacterium]
MKNPRSFSILALLAALHAASVSDRSRGCDDRGQTTAEYALVLLGAAGIAVLLVGWATKSGAIGALFDAVLDGVVGRVK